MRKQKLISSRNKLNNAIEKKFYSLSKTKRKIFGTQTGLLVLLQNEHEFKQKTTIYSQTSRFIAGHFHFYKVMTNLNK